ncbi:MAG: glycosyltransferase [Verrucomicrobia bacterium]|nr:glycosyltransferase [Verrucomicrobiota bacterium]
MKKTPILAVEATRLCTEYRDSGVALYIKHILRGLHAQDGLRAVCFGKEIAQECIRELPTGTEFYLSKDGPFIWRNTALQHLQKKWGCELAWFPFQIVPWLPCMPFVATIHDYGFLRLGGDGMSLKSCLYLSGCLGNVLLRSKTILSISEATTRGVVKRFPWAGKKIVTARHGLPDEVRELSEKMDFPFSGKPRDLMRCVFLAGENERKRFDLALLACERISKATPVELVVTGSEDRVRARAQAVLGFVPPFLRCVGRLSRPQLLELYQTSHVLLYLSYFEGFGFPILEALALGAQVICLPGEAEQEVGGGCVGYANPATPEKVEEKLREALERCRNADMIRAGVFRARSFTWKPSLEAHARAFKPN